ncbi:MAG: DMT family transporter [Alphaproteobacteria bacterium]|nr:DMT family transporter [Alphaproteobacteria bacterium]
MTSPDARPGPGRAVYLFLAIIVLTWAANWPLMKLALSDAPPLVFVLVRLLGTVALLAPTLAAMRVPLLPIPGERLGLFWVGELQVAGFLLFAIVGLAIEAPGRAIVLAYTFSLWAIPIGVLLGVERLGRFHLIGAAIGFAGLVLFMNPGLVDWSSPRALFGNLFLLLSAIAWALGSCLYRRRMWRTGFWTQTFWQLAVSAPVVLAFALPQLSGEPIHWSARLLAILAYNWVVTTALGYFLWAKVLTAMPAATAGQVLALTPVGGFLLSILIFGGTVTPDVIASIALIVAGIILTLRA